MKRTIAAILAADVVGYSRLIAEDEEDTIRRLAEYGEVFRGFVREFGGRVFNTAGDAILAEFPSAVEALRAAVAIQETLFVRNRELPAARRLAFRMGLTIGDVVEVEGDLLGDGVNIAARLEGIAEPGGICLARSVHEAVANKVAVTFRDIGPQRLKNIPRPVHAFRVVWQAEPAAHTSLGTRLRGAVTGHPLRALALAAAPVAAVAVLWVVLSGRGEPRPEENQDAPAQANRRGDDPAAPAVSTASARSVCFKDQVWLSGILVPRKEVDVRPDGDGLRVVSVSVEPLSTVAAGQLLAHLARAGEAGQTVVTLRSPASGIVGRVNATPGGVISARSPAPFQIIAQGEFDLSAEVPLAALDRLSPGQAATVTPLGLPEVHGQVRTVSVPADSATQSGRVKIEITDAGDLRQGTFARGIVEIAERCGVAVPTSALMIGDDGRFVYVVAGDRIEARRVATGLTSGEDIEIRSGLSREEVVVSRAGAFLQEGAAITPVLSEVRR